jgi:hypothetical protein
MTPHPRGGSGRPVTGHRCSRRSGTEHRQHGRRTAATVSRARLAGRHRGIAAAVRPAAVRVRAGGAARKLRAVPASAGVIAYVLGIGATIGRPGLWPAGILLAAAGFWLLCQAGNRPVAALSAAAMVAGWTPCGLDERFLDRTMLDPAGRALLARAQDAIDVICGASVRSSGLLAVPSEALADHERRIARGLLAAAALSGDSADARSARLSLTALIEVLECYADAVEAADRAVLARDRASSHMAAHPGDVAELVAQSAGDRVCAASLADLAGEAEGLAVALQYAAGHATAAG